ncbi:glycosyltransferase family 2 protein [archaeon]|jgi:glycosyltransferase involved in cell wall biosynthesis|nr:glycosyltransferase family 2 protein [archaeon]MBT4242078.1 glycosyltransferase family 2 protein [archaeon]MBT4417766.1 glycosyltransferase family 2 protein [archaeon]
MKHPEVSITIPIYNEERGIEKTVRNLVNEFEKHEVDYQLVLVNHGSWDKTDEVLNKLGNENQRLKVVNLPKNLGYGGGIMYGFDKSDGEYIGFTCADEEVSAQDVYKVYEKLKINNFDVSKSRRMQRKDGLFRKFTSFVFNSLIRIRFNLNLKDVNGYPIFMKRELFPAVRTKELAYLFNLDFLKKMSEKKYKIVEVPIIHREREVGKSYMKMPRIINMALGFFKYGLDFRN